MPSWLVIGLEAGIPSPNKEYRAVYEDREILLRPETNQWAPDVVIAFEPPDTMDEALRLAGIQNEVS